MHTSSAINHSVQLANGALAVTKEHDVGGEMTTQQDNAIRADVLEKVLLGGDLSRLTPQERLQYYRATCTSLGLNPLTKPFDYLQLEDKLVLYARRDCGDQLRKIHDVSVKIIDRELIDGVYTVKAHAKMPNGREDESIGAVPLVKEAGEWRTAQSGKRYFESTGHFQPLAPNDRANAIMKAETKAKRRVTLSICGLGMLDESEIETISAARPYQESRIASEVAEHKEAEIQHIVQEQKASKPVDTTPAAVRRIWAEMSKSREAFMQAFTDARDTLTDLQGDEGYRQYQEIVAKHGIGQIEAYKGKMQPARDCVLELFNVIQVLTSPPEAKE